MQTPPTQRPHIFTSAVRALHILDVVERSARGRRLAELSAELGLDKATALRTLDTLVAERVLAKDARTHRYSPNLTSWTHLALFLSPALSLISSVQRVLDNLAESAAATSLVVLPAQGGRTVLAPLHAEPDAGLYYDPRRAPEASPLHATAAGKCLLAALPRTELARYLNSPLERATDRTITSRRPLERELEQVRREGYALTQGETRSGSSALAVPLRRPDGAVIGGLAWGYVGESVAQEKVSGHLPELQKAAEQISGMMSYRSWLDCIGGANRGPLQLRSPWAGRSAGSGSAPASYVRTVARMSRLTGHLICHPRGLSLGLLADEHGLRKATVWRLLRSLSCCSVVCQDAPHQSYRIDPLFWLQRAPLVRATASLARAAEGVLQQVADATGATAGLGVPDREERYALTFCYALPPGPVCWRAEYAPPAPLHVTATGKCYLAAQSKVSVERYISRGLQAMTEASITSPQDLLQELARVRQQGYALSQGEMSPGIGVLGVPVSDADGAVVGALAIIGVMPMFPEDRVKQWLPVLRAAARRLSPLPVAHWREQLEQGRDDALAGPRGERIT